MDAKEKLIRDTLGLKLPGAGRKNYSVKAGAGGGKTTLLSQRICNQLLLGTPIEEFVIITYTNAAAAELREKITVRLQQLIREGIPDALQRENAGKALNTVELMQVSTIHAFLFKLLRENAFESGVVTDAKMLEDFEDRARRTKFFDAWYHMHFDEMKAFATDWVLSTSRGYKTDHTREVFENMFHDLANVREEVVYDTSDHSAALAKEAKDYVTYWLPVLRNFKSEFINNQPRKKDKAGTPYKWLKGPQEIIDAISLTEGRNACGIEEACILSKALSGIKKIVDKGDNFYYNGLEPNWKLSSVIPDFSGGELDWNFTLFYEEFVVNAEKAAKVVEYVCKMREEYQKQIDEETRVLSNDDILYRAEKLLTEHPEVLKKLKKRYTKIYVDEFQDTTGVQTGIIKLLSGGYGDDVTENVFAEDKLLVVGDPKQSIYRFTGAEKAVYDAMDRLMKELPDTLAESVSLDTNFRSNRKVVDWVNHSFGRLMGSEYGPMNTDWVVTEQKALHGVYRYVPQPNVAAGGKSDGYSLQNDVDAVCGLVKRLVGNKQCFIEKSARNADGTFGTPELASIQYSDIMIICKNTTHMSDYVERFAREGIPVNVQGRFKITDDVVMRNFVLLAECFAGYKNKKKQITAAQTLLGEDITGVDKSTLEAEEGELRSLRKQFRDNQMDCAAILQYLLAHEELYLPKGEVQATERVRSYRIRLHQMVETCLGKNEGDLSEAVCLLREYLNNDVRREIPLESNENAVRLMNAHQSKGLTGQIVIIADRSTEEKYRYSGFKKAGKYYPAVSYKANSFGAYELIPSYGYDKAMLEQVYREEKEEALRLQYVAATRAAHALIIMPVAGKAKNVWFTAPEYGYDSLTDINLWLQEREADTAEYGVVAADAGATHETVTLAELEENLTRADKERQAAAQMVSITPSGLEPKGVTGYSHGEESYVKEDRPSANIFGLVMHRVYELVAVRYERIRNLSDAERESLVERMINQALIEQEEELRREDKPEEFMAYLKPLMLQYLRTVLEAIFENAEEIYPEYSFSFYVPEEERELFIAEFGHYLEKAKVEIRDGSGPIWVNGQADLVVKQKDGTVKVYDYKSDAMNGKPKDLFEKALEEKYEGQLALYRYAIGKAFGVENVETELIHLYR